MKAKEIHEMTSEELTKKLAELKDELFNLRFRHATGQLENPNVLNGVKKDIARVKTVMRQRELGLAKAPETSVAATKKTTKKTAKVDAEVKG